MNVARGIWRIIQQFASNIQRKLSPEDKATSDEDFIKIINISFKDGEISEKEFQRKKALLES
jgi:hypothetical protein